MKKITVNLPDDQVAFLQEIAKADNVTFTDALRRSINSEKFFVNQAKSGNKVLVEGADKSIREVMRKSWGHAYIRHRVIEGKQMVEDKTGDGSVPPDKKSTNNIGLDFTGDSETSDDEQTLFLGANYDPRPQEDGARRTIAYLLIGLLWVIVSGILILISFGTITVDNIKEFGVVLSPVIALVSAATGFYYGSKSHSTDDT
jgi:hypothetical protein